MKQIALFFAKCKTEDLSRYILDLIKHQKAEIERLNKEVDRLSQCVIVSPCKVGDVVYVLQTCSCAISYKKFEKCYHRPSKSAKWIDLVQVTHKNRTKCIKLFEKSFKMEYIDKIGKTVFLTKEQAEQKLKEMVGDKNDG